MCLAKIYMRRNDDLELVLSNVATLDVSDGKITLTTILEEIKELQASIRILDFENAFVILESSK